MKSRDVFLAAAAFIASGKNNGFGACRAIARARKPGTRVGLYNYKSREHNAFAEMFPWHTGEVLFVVEPNADELRILALCFLAAMSRKSA